MPTGSPEESQRLSRQLPPEVIQLRGDISEYSAREKKVREATASLYAQELTIVHRLSALVTEEIALKGILAFTRFRAEEGMRSWQSEFSEDQEQPLPPGKYVVSGLAPSPKLPQRKPNPKEPKHQVVVLMPEPRDENVLLYGAFPHRLEILTPGQLARELASRPGPDQLPL